MSHHSLHVLSQKKQDARIKILASSWKWSEHAVAIGSGTVLQAGRSRVRFPMDYGPGIDSACDRNISRGIKVANA